MYSGTVHIQASQSWLTGTLAPTCHVPSVPLWGGAPCVCACVAFLSASERIKRVIGLYFSKLGQAALCKMLNYISELPARRFWPKGEWRKGDTNTHTLSLSHTLSQISCYLASLMDHPPHLTPIPRFVSLTNMDRVHVSLIFSRITFMNTHPVRYLSQAHSGWQMGAPDDECHQICVSRWEPSLTPFKPREHSGLH